MIYDSIENMIRHVPRFVPNTQTLTAFLTAAHEKTFEELRAIDFSPLDARYDEYVTKAAHDNLLEAHRKYWDLQILMAGKELVGYAPLQTLAEKIPYDPGEDIAFYEGAYQSFLLGHGMAMLLAPWDAHLPQIAVGAPAPVKKIVVKLPW
ncbi:YhcH/YjgK/YiaL family protein [Synergistaceae bacterium OttesenSCG-928-D05]|nr:YhcH/YjgK/YiaL family protein [Synergistaceae bacterium OttesenSCG-928-D05]